MRFKTPASLFNVNGEHGARACARRLFINRSKIQRSSINQYYLISREVVVGCGGSYCQETQDREKSANLF
jgi:hypothetical protein